MQKTKRDVIRLHHMLDAAEKALRFFEGKQRTDLDTNEQLSLALVHLVMVIGEAANKTVKDFRERYPQIPWSDIINTRHRLIHAYDQVNLDILWQIIVKDLPLLVNQLKEIISQEEQQQEMF